MLSITPSPSVNLAILQRSGEIASVNEGWKRFAKSNGLRTPRFGVGLNYLDCCRSPDRDTSRSLGQIRALLRGEIDLVSFVYRCDSPRKKRAFVLIGASLSQDPERAVLLAHLNVSAMLLASFSAPETARAVERATSEGLADHLARMPGLGISSPPRIPALSPREWAVLRLLGEGKTNKEIAALLSRSPNTIKIHVSNILEKLKLRSRTEAALMGFKFSDTEGRRTTAAVSCTHLQH